MIKRTITITVAAVTALLVFPIIGKTQKTINTPPDVIINGTISGVKGYVASFVIEDNQYPADKCPKSILSYAIKGDYDFNLNTINKHCPKCSSGIFTTHEGETYQRCTFCGSPE
jgi:ribosomal protein S27AE